MLTTVITPHTPVAHGGNPLGASLSLWEKTALAPLNPLLACGEGRQSIALAGVGFFEFNKQSSGHDTNADIFPLS